MTLRQPRRIYTNDESTNKALAEIYQALEDWARDPELDRKTITISLPSGSTVKTNHGLGRAYRQVLVGPPKGPASAGVIEIIEPTDRSKQVWLKATGYGATVTVVVTLE